MTRETVELECFDVREWFEPPPSREPVGIAACVPRFRKSLIGDKPPRAAIVQATSTVFGATKRALPMMSSAPLAL